MKKLELTTIKKDLPTQYKGMLDNISSYYPVVAKAMTSEGKVLIMLQWKIPKNLNKHPKTHPFLKLI